MTDKESAKSGRRFRFLPLTMSIETAGGIATPLALRGTPLPAVRSQSFSTAADNQNSVLIKVLMGESPVAEKNVLLASVQLTGIPKAPKGTPGIQVVFEIDEECKLRVSAVEKKTKSQISVDTNEALSHLSAQDIERLLAQAEEDRAEDQELLNRAEVGNKGEAIISRAEAYLRNRRELTYRTNGDAKIEQALAALGLALDQDNARGIGARVEELEKLLPRLTDQFGLFGGSDDIFSAFFPPPKRSPSAQARAKAPKQDTPSQKAPTKNRSPSYNLATTQSRSAVIGKIFGGGEFTPDSNLCFVLMPFAEHMTAVYHDHIRPVVASKGLSPLRADEVHGTNTITRDIWEKVNRARFIVADLTGQNPNVFYEVGLAHALGKEVILLTQSMEDVPFDLKSLRCIVYSFTPRGMQDMERRLRATITEIMRSS